LHIRAPTAALRVERLTRAYCAVLVADVLVRGAMLDVALTAAVVAAASEVGVEASRVCGWILAIGIDPRVARMCLLALLT
jgi:hypothetical protein